MLIKDQSLSKKIGWEEYADQSWMLFFKFGGSTSLSLVIYAVVFGIINFMLSEGGIENGLKAAFGGAK